MGVFKMVLFMKRVYFKGQKVQMGHEKYMLRM